MNYLLFAQQSGQGGDWWISLIPMLLVLLIFYLVLFRPLKKEKEQHQKLLDNLTKNDKVVTQGGIHGIVTNIKDNEVTVKVDDSKNVKIKVAKWAIASVVNKKDKDSK